MNRETKKGIAFGVLDVFLILLIIVSAAGIAVRYVLTDQNGILAVTPTKTSAAVQVLITSIEDTSAVHFYEGAVFTVGEKGETGEILNVNEKPAEYYTENEEGELFVAYDESGKKDVRCTVTVSGYYRDGIFLLGGVEPMLPGASVALSSGDVKVTALIIDSAPLEG